MVVLASCSQPVRAPGIDQGFDYSPAWSPDGNSIAYVHSPARSESAEKQGIYVVRLDSLRRTQISTRFVRSVDWSPDGRSILFDAPDGLYRMAANGDSARRIFDGTAYFPEWCPAADTIVFDDISDIWLIHADGGIPRKLGHIRGRDPSWSPDGERLVLLSAYPDASGEELSIVGVRDTSVRRLTHNDHEDRSPSWSPTGNEIAWNKWPRSNGSVRPEVWLIDTAGVAEQKVLVAETDISWSPDGQSITFVKTTSSGPRVFTASRTGSQLRQITF